MNANRLSNYLDHMLEAAHLACSYVEGMNKDDYLADKRTQQATILNIVVIGEAATKLLNLESSVERAGVYGFPGAWQGATTRNGRSIARSCNAAMRPENCAIQLVALSPNG